MSESIDEFISVVSLWKPEWLVPSAWLEHAPFAFWLVDKARPRRIVELGTAHGFSYMCMCQAVHRTGLDAECYAVDTWDGDEHAGFYGEDVFLKLKEYNDSNYRSFSKLIRSTFDQAVSHFDDQSIDILHLDGRHFYEDVKEDFERWSPKLSRRAVVLFHDTSVRERDFGVWRYWNELHVDRPGFEFQHGYGLGILAFGEEIPEALRPLFAASAALGSRIRSLYAHLGIAAVQLASGEQAEGETRAHTDCIEDHAGALRGDSERWRLLSEQTSAEVVALRQEKEQLAAALAALRQEKEQLLATWDGRLSALTQAAAGHAEAAEALRTEASRAQAKYNEIAHSTTWRATAPLRAMLGRAPLIRRTARRSAKLVYWIATPWETSRRLHYLRQRKQAEGRLGGAVSPPRATRPAPLAPTAPRGAAPPGGFSLVSEAVRFSGGARPLAATAWRVLRQEGFRGVRIRVERLRGSLASPPSDYAMPAVAEGGSGGRPLRVVWIINRHDRMTHRYRVFNYIDVIKKDQFSCHVVFDDETDRLDLAGTNVVVFCRTVWTQRIQSLIDRCRELDIRTIFDIDDLLFDEDRLDLIPHLRWSRPAYAEQIRQLVAGLRRTLERCEIITVSTNSLLAEVERIGRAAWVVRNNNGLAQQALADKLRHERARETSGPVRVGYFSGTYTHNDDFAVCADALAEALAADEKLSLVIMGELDMPPRLTVMRNRIERHPLGTHDEMLRVLSTVDINLAPLELNNAFADCKSELKIFEAALFGIPTIASPTTTFAGVIQPGRTGFLARTSEEWLAAIAALGSSPALRQEIGERARSEVAGSFEVSETAKVVKSLLCAAVNRRVRLPVDSTPATAALREPAISIVAVLYRKEREVRFFLESVRRQRFKGSVEVILVEDCTPDDSIAVVEQFMHWTTACCAGGGRMDVRILRNERNLGNCGSRNRGVAAARADVVVVVDADCMLNRDFLAAHHEQHLYPDSEVVIGPLNIETGTVPPLVALERHETDSCLAEIEAAPQDRVNLDSFVNCITRNFSIKRRFIEEKLGEALFDEAFAYSADPASGFGWEDVEMGYRLYAAGARIKYTPAAVSIHVSHPPTTSEHEKPVRSLRNYRRLFEKHPDILLCAREWSVRTYGEIVRWAKSAGADLGQNEDCRWLERIMRPYRQSPIIIDRSRPLRILTHRWHCSHQYELYKIGHHFTLVRGAGTALCENWEVEKRPMPANAAFCRASEIDFSSYDLAVVHFDENVLNPELCHGKVPLDWGRTLLWFLDNVKLPIVAVCHGTPQFYGQYDGSYRRPDLLKTIEPNRAALVDLMSRANVVVCNSHQAMEEWSFRSSRVIWHGFAPHEYPRGAGGDRILTMSRSALENRPHYNGLTVLKEVERVLGQDGSISTLSVTRPGPPYAFGTRQWAVSLYQNYVREIGRFGVYFNPTQRSPMPRSRAEAMMAGLVTVSLRNHDVDMFIKNGVDGFYADSPGELAEQLAYLMRAPEKREAMARRSRALAMNIFNQDRYLSNWSTLLREVTG